MRRTVKWLAAPLVLMGLSFQSSAVPLDDNINSFIDRMVTTHHFDKAQLETLLKNTTYRDDIIASISKPYEGKPWHQYRKIFVTDKRAQRGLDFWDKHRDTLARAEKEYGVPAEIIVAILGVETHYGRNKGKHRVIDALTTLAFKYPPRSKFFTSELEEFLLLSREERIDPNTLLGSYAGAMGEPQFISSSYRHYAVDFSGDGQRDLINNTDDAIGSVAHYFNQHGWIPNAPIATPAKVVGKSKIAEVSTALKPSKNLVDLQAYGIYPTDNLDNQPASLITLETENKPQHWLGLQNFYVITRYNHSAHYAMAVYQLSEKIKGLRQARLSQSNTAYG